MDRFFRRALAVAGLVGTAICGAWAQSGTWQPLTNQPPFAPSTMFLLMDGSILCQADYPNGTTWAKLTPDVTGSYANGTWSPVASSPWSQKFYGSGVFADGRVIVCGGEYSNAGADTNKTEIYDPSSDQWTEISGPPGWTYVGDAPCGITADGRFIIGSITDQRTAFYDPILSSWFAGPTKRDTKSAEESWCLLPDGSFLAVECVRHPATERWIPSTNSWIDAGATSLDLVLPNSLEVGGSLALPDGRAFVIGANGFTGLYTLPNGPSLPGGWLPGPTFGPIDGRQIGAEDAPAVLEPNGKVLIAVGPVSAKGGSFDSPTYFFEFDGTQLTRVDAPDNGFGPPYVGRFMLAPSGEILFAASGQIQVYTSVGSPDPSWKPTITVSPGTVLPGGQYTIQGTQFNGLSQAVAYGDDVTTATNYPIVRIVNNATGNVAYCRSYNPSTMAIATGSAPVITNFEVPHSLDLGASTIQVVANGIASDPVPINVANGITVEPIGFSVVPGLTVSGGIPDLQHSDNHYLVVQRGFTITPTDDPLEVTFTGSPQVLNPTTMQFSIETSALGPGVIQRLRLYNYVTRTWDLVDQRRMDATDKTVTVNVAAGPYFDALTGQVQAKASYTYFALGLGQNFRIRFDWVSWTLTH